jgi:hypothetical protein
MARPRKTPKNAVTNGTNTSASPAPRIARWVLTVATVVFFYKFAWEMYFDKAVAARADEFEMEATLFSEQAFYFSYFKDVAGDRHKSWRAALASLTSNDRTESPDTINVVQRFTIHPEIFLGLVYRTVVPNVITPVLFYTYATWVGYAASMGVFFNVAVSVNQGSLAAGVLALALAVLNYNERSRHGVGLREKWGLQMMICQYASILFLFQQQRNGRPTRRALFIFGFCTFCFMTSWQLSHSLMFLQTACMQTIYCLGLLSKEQNITILKVYMLVIVTASLSHFGGSRMHHVQSMFVHSVLAGLVTTSYGPNHTAPGAGSFLLRLRTTIASIVLFLGTFAAIWLLAQHFFDDGDASHVLGVIQVNLGLRETTDLNLRKYLAQPEFRPMKRQLYWDYTTKLLLPLSVLSGCRTVVSIVQHLRTGHESVTPEAVFLFLQWLCFSIVSAIMMRFNVLMEPCAMLLASMLFHPANVDLGCAVIPSFFWVGFRHKASKRTVLLSFACMLLASYVHVSKLGDTISQEFSHKQQHVTQLSQPALNRWINAHTHKDAVVVADMVTGSIVKASTGRKLVMHPQYENANLRDRDRKVSQLYGRRSTEYIHRLMNDTFGADYVVVHKRRCFTRFSDGSSTGSLVNDEILQQNPGKQLSAPPFCEMIPTFENNKNKFFRLVYMGNFGHNTHAVLQVVKRGAKLETEPYSEVAIRTDPLTLLNSTHLGITDLR